MSNLRASFYALVLLSLASCKKELSPEAEKAAGIQGVSTGGGNVNQSQSQTIFGIISSSGGIFSTPQAQISTTESQMSTANVSLVRLPLYLSQTTVGQTINQFINDGYSIQINLNWYSTGMGAMPYPKDIATVRKQADAFFKYYQPYRNQIPVVVVENEWDNTAYHSGTIQDYLNELAAITDVGHQYGFKIADGGLTSNGLRRWTYSALTGDQATQWKNEYYVGYNMNNYSLLIGAVNSFAAGLRNIPLDYVNVHWYNDKSCENGFALATQTYMAACGKKAVICNEFGIKSNSESLFSQTIAELSGKASFAIAYNGSGVYGQAIKLTNNMLGMLN